MLVSCGVSGLCRTLRNVLVIMLVQGQVTEFSFSIFMKGHKTHNIYNTIYIEYRIYIYIYNI